MSQEKPSQTEPTLSDEHKGCSHVHSELSGNSHEEIISDAIEMSALKAVFPNPAELSELIRKLGKVKIMEHINANLPLEAIKSIALENNQPLEKKDVSIGFIPITCATPIIMAEPMGFYHRHGLNMSLKKASDWEVVKNWAMKDEIDAAHMLCTMPLAMTLGLESSPKKFVMPAVEDNNGSALTIHRKYNSIKTTQEMKGMTIAIPYKFSMHNYLLRYYLAENQLNPDKDITIIEVPPPKMLEALEKGEIDAFFAPDPFNQLAVLNKIGFIYLLSKEIWDGHPCCAFSVSEEFTQQCPNTFKALFKAIVDATLFCSSMNNRKHIAKIIAPEPYLNQPVEILEQVLLGQYPDGRGVWKREPRRIHFDPFPWQSMAVWILTQMKRWGQVSDDFNFRDIAEKVYLAEDCDNEIKCLGYKKRGKSYTQHKIMNKVFDPFKAQQYLDSF